MRLNSIRFKASILYSAIMAVILSLFSSVIYISIHNILYHDLDQELKVKGEEISSILHAYNQIERGRSHRLNSILELLQSESAAAEQRVVIDDLWRSQLEVLNLKNDFINIVNKHGQTIFSSFNLNSDIATLFRRDIPFNPNSVDYKKVSGEDVELRAINLPVRIHDNPLVIQVGTPISTIQYVLHRLLFFMISATFIFLIGTSFLGSYFVRHSLKPVKEVIHVANRITHKDLSARIEERDIDQEMHELVNAFNVMIKRLETSFGHINEFSSHAAHELKTPLAILRGEIELALDQENPPEEYQRVLRDCLGEIDRMIKVVKDLLLLAKLDYKPEIFQFERISLTSLLGEIAEQSKILAESKHIDVRFDLPVHEIFIEADKVHLRRLFHNIIGNAIKYIPDQASIIVGATIQGDHCHIGIRDTGEGISAENLKSIFQKFFRVTKSTDSADTGTGLGLSIALAIAKAHNGDITVESQPGEGTTFTVILPVSKA